MHEMAHLPRCKAANLRKLSHAPGRKRVALAMVLVADCYQPPDPFWKPTRNGRISQHQIVVRTRQELFADEQFRTKPCFGSGDGFCCCHCTGACAILYLK